MSLNTGVLCHRVSHSVTQGVTQCCLRHIVTRSATSQSIREAGRCVTADPTPSFRSFHLFLLSELKKLAFHCRFLAIAFNCKLLFQLSPPLRSIVAHHRDGLDLCEAIIERVPGRIR